MNKDGQAIKLAELCVKAERSLQNLGYKQSTITHCKTAWREFLEYSLQHGQENFEDELATNYLKDNYNYPDLTKAVHSKIVNSRAASIRKLSDLYHFGSYLIRMQRYCKILTVMSLHGMAARSQQLRRNLQILIAKGAPMKALLISCFV